MSPDDFSSRPPNGQTDGQTVSDTGGVVAFPDYDAFTGQRLEERRKRRRRAKRAAGEESTDLNLIPIMGLFTAMVLYLLKSYASDPVNIKPGPEIRLPTSTTKLIPQKAVQVAISDKIVLVNDKLVARVENGRVAKRYKKNEDEKQLLIEPLKKALDAEAEREKLFAKNNKKVEFGGMLTVIADKRTPFRLLTEVLYSAGQAEYGSYKFAVLKQAS